MGVEIRQQERQTDRRLDYSCSKICRTTACSLSFCLHLAHAKPLQQMQDRYSTYCRTDTTPDQVSNSRSLTGDTQHITDCRASLMQRHTALGDREKVRPVQNHAGPPFLNHRRAKRIACCGQKEEPSV